jgi:alkylation response protein AidB-like acyl-CoA dehydrogenase
MSRASTSAELLAPDLDREDVVPAWRSVAGEFAEHVVRPVGRALDPIDAREVIRPGSLLHEFLAVAYREGFTRLGMARHDGGLGLSRREECLVVEELATADAGLTALLVVAPTPFRWAAEVGRPALEARLAKPYLSGERADWIGCCALAGLAGPARATRAGDGWRLTGLTAPALAGAIATHALVACTVDQGGARVPALAGVALDRRGVRRRPAVGGPGLRGRCRAALELDRVQLAFDELVPVSCARSAERPGGGQAQAASALVAFGIGRAAYEGALRCAREAVWLGDVPSANALARPQLSRMYTLLEATQALVRSASRSTERTPGADAAAVAEQAHAASAFAAEAAFELAEDVLRLCGAIAAQGDVPFLDGSTFDPAKLLRDARTARLTMEQPDHGPCQDT